MTAHSSRAPTIAVVGGGISGLAAAHRLGEIAAERGRPIELRLFEAAPRLGGNIRSERAEGCLVEGGPDQFVRHKPAALELCRRLGLAGELIDITAGPPSMLVARRGRVVALPVGFSMMGPAGWRPLFRAELLSLRGKLRGACERWVPAPRGPIEDESLRSFVTRRFGPELFDRVFEPILAGIFTADADRMSVEMTLPQLLRLEREHGSLHGAFRRMHAGRARGGRPAAACATLRGGLERLPQTLASRLPEGSVRTSAVVERAGLDSERRRWRLSVRGQPETEADALVLACAGHASARFLDDPELARELGLLEYASCATVSLAYAAEAIGRPLQGLGFFVGRGEGLPILACNHVSVKFPDRVPAGQVVLRAFCGGAREGRVLDGDDESLVGLAHRALAGLLDIEGPPAWGRVHRYPRSMPQYPVGYRRQQGRLTDLAARRPGLFLCGGVVGAVGLPDCIASAEETADRVIEFLAARLVPTLAGRYP